MSVRERTVSNLAGYLTTSIVRFFRSQYSIQIIYSQKPEIKKNGGFGLYLVYYAKICNIKLVQTFD